jgi:hypothetical protein
MSAAQGRPVTFGDRRTRTALPDLGVNVGRAQREHAPLPQGAGSLSAYRERRVIIDVQTNGEFTVYSDPDVQAICRCAHIPEDEFVRIDHRKIPEEWLEVPVGHSGDGSVADLLAEVVADWPDGDQT